MGVLEQRDQAPERSLLDARVGQHRARKPGVVRVLAHQHDGCVTQGERALLEQTFDECLRALGRGEQALRTTAHATRRAAHEDADAQALRRRIWLGHGVRPRAFVHMSAKASTSTSVPLASSFTSSGTTTSALAQAMAVTA